MISKTGNSDAKTTSHAQSSNPPYEPPRNVWRHKLHRAIVSKQKHRRIQYRPTDFLECMGRTRASHLSPRIHNISFTGTLSDWADHDYFACFYGVMNWVYPNRTRSTAYQLKQALSIRRQIEALEKRLSKILAGSARRTTRRARRRPYISSATHKIM